ncbi:MAG: methyltransferase domain-containing protein [Pseudonocardiales bacterium]|nr:methyltransferase domain-containing protein [Pseudonocardiales bacterium]MBV9029381.1 methyltransferase domain-containing protein [Pseudonocardiales bacterium]
MTAAAEEQVGHRQLVEHLTESGVLGADWQPVFEAVPRAEFIPETVWVEGDGGVLVPLYRTQDPQRWRELAYADDAIITQVDDGHPALDGTGRRISSSASMPTVVAQMLAHCAAQPGQRVLEIGTGTGYNAALLAQRLDAGNVVTIEIDPELAQTARNALTAAGYDAVTVVTGDGAQGYPPAAPFDRVLSTTAVQQVPYDWVDQTRPGGLVITPWGTDYYNGGLLVLTVTEEHTALGCLVDKASFMTLRQQRLTRPGLTLTAEDDAHATCSYTDIHPADIANGHVAFDACIALAIRVPHCAMSYAPPELDTDGEGILWLIDAHSGSWARLHHHPDHDGPYRVLQSGSRHLWDEIHTNYHWWLNAGRPPADRWRFTITPEGQHIQLGPRR